MLVSSGGPPNPNSEASRSIAHSLRQLVSCRDMSAIFPGTCQERGRLDDVPFPRPVFLPHLEHAGIGSLKADSPRLITHLAFQSDGAIAAASRSVHHAPSVRSSLAIAHMDVTAPGNVVPDQLIEGQS